MKAWLGKCLIALGVVHTIFGLIVLGDLLMPVVRGGLFNTLSASTPPESNMAFWFLMFGFAILLLGVLLDSVERAGAEIPGFLAWGLLAVTALGCVIMPASGFWLLWIPIVGLFIRQRSAVKASATADAA